MTTIAHPAFQAPGPRRTTMKNIDPTRHFRLAVRGDQRWEIRTMDGSLVARLTRTDDDTAVVEWVRTLPLPREYSSPQAALADLVMWEERPRGGTKPIPIPHAPPSPQAL